MNHDFSSSFTATRQRGCRNSPVAFRFPRQKRHYPGRFINWTFLLSSRPPDSSPQSRIVLFSPANPSSSPIKRLGTSARSSWLSRRPRRSSRPPPSTWLSERPRRPSPPTPSSSSGPSRQIFIFQVPHLQKHGKLRIVPSVI
jgi:hypothetical protein